jgi:hypothetical protein
VAGQSDKPKRKAGGGSSPEVEAVTENVVANPRYDLRSSDKLGYEIRVTPNPDDDSFSLAYAAGSVAPGQHVSLCILGPVRSLEFESGHWSETPKSSSALVGGKLVAEDVIIRPEDLYQPTDRRRINSPNLTRLLLAGWAGVLGLAIIFTAYHLTQRSISLPSSAFHGAPY